MGPRLRCGGANGLLSDLKSEGYEVQELRFVDDQGRRVGGFGANVFRSLTGGRYVSVARDQLARSIYHKIESRCETIFDDSITNIEQDGDGTHVTFERAPARRFDLVIGADGLHSAVRKLVFGSQDWFEKYLGYRVAVFEIEGYRPRDEGSALMIRERTRPSSTQSLTMSVGSARVCSPRWIAAMVFTLTASVRSEWTRGHADA